MMSCSGGPFVRATDGNVSVRRLNHNMWKAKNGSGRPIIMLRNMDIIPTALPIKRYFTNIFMLSNMVLPSSIALTMVANESSARIILLASLLTSVPVIPIAIPTSALFIAGASLTPSPVTATISPRFIRLLTILILFSAVTLANITSSFRASVNSSSLILPSSRPVIIFVDSVASPTCLAIALAVRP